MIAPFLLLRPLDFSSPYDSPNGGRAFRSDDLGRGRNDKRHEPIREYRMVGKINKRRYPLQTYEDYRERGPSPVLES